MAERPLSDREILIGSTRAALGQGLGMGWGDEAEAWLRSKLGQGSYEDMLKRIRSEYGTFSERYPLPALGAEFAGGVLPGVAAMMIPGGQPAGAAQLTSAAARLAARPIVRSAVAGGTSGAVSGAGSAVEDSRGTGALVGGVLGTGLGAVVPPVMRAASTGREWLSERLAPSAAKAGERATGKLAAAASEARLTPQQIEARMAADRAMGVPSVVANVDPAVANLAETLAQRSGRGARAVEEGLAAQQAGSRERVYQQTRRALQPGDYYGEEERLLADLRTRSAPAYERAYAAGEVDDQQIQSMLALPQFRTAWDTARRIAEADAAAAKVNAMRAGQPFDPNEFKLRDIYKIERDDLGNPIGVEVTGQVPDVRTLDYMKRALDAQINAGYRSDNAATLASAAAMKDLRNALRDRTKEVVPEYADALQVYKGDREILDALRAGREDFRSLDHEEVGKLVAGMSPAEKDAFRTGVVRDLYGRLFGSSRNIDAGAIMGAPEMRAKMQPLFDSPAHYDLFQAAVARESQLHKQAGRILAGSQTGKRLAMREEFEGDDAVARAAGEALRGGFLSSLTGIASRALYKTTMTEEMAERLAQMLMSRDPADVATVVRALEEYAQRAAPKAAAATRREMGTTTGAAISGMPAPAGESEPADIERDLAERESQIPLGPSIEEALRQQEESKRGR
jgi:hypothetical protein